MTTVNIGLLAKLPIAVKRYARNTTPVSAEFQNILADSAGYIGSIRGLKQVFTWSAEPDDIPASSAGTRSRWRCAFHTAPFTQHIQVWLLVAKQDNGSASDPYVRCSLYNAAGTSLLAKFERHYGASSSTTDIPSEWGFGYFTLQAGGPGTPLVEVDPDTDYTLLFEDVDYGRILSASVVELPYAPDTDNGYPSTDAGTGTAILDIDRGLIADIGRKVHKTWAAQLWNHTSDTDATARTFTTTYTNLVDGSSTSVSSSTPGATIDLRHRTTIRMAADGVPVKMRVYASSTGADTGTVRLKDSSGTTMLEASITGTTAAWYDAIGYLPASLAKYDLHGGGAASATVTVYAVSVYELDYSAFDMTTDDTTMAQMRIRAFDATASLA
jgi:hypothetical protein